MKGKTMKIIIGILIAAIVVVGGLLVVKSLAPATGDQGSVELKDMSEGTPAISMEPAGAKEV